MYFILTWTDREVFLSIIIIYTFFRLMNRSSDLFFTLDMTEIPSYVKLKANRLLVCIIYFSGSSYS